MVEAFSEFLFRGIQVLASLDEMIGRQLHDAQTEYIRLQIDSGVPEKAKRALQQLCKWYRRGAKIAPRQRFALENSVVGLVCSSPNEKVRRWALNALALIGTPDTSLHAVHYALEKYKDEPQTIAAAIAALFKLEQDAYNVLLKKDRFSHDIIILSALQNADPKNLNLDNTRINIENSTADILKLALITVGLDCAPEYIFHPRYTNAQIVNILGTHDDKIVSQYSVWAITENPNLGITDLGISVDEIDGQPENVRGWVYELHAMETGACPKRHELVVRGSKDVSEVARVGLARGLRNTFYDKLDGTVLDWHLAEGAEEVRAFTMDHMVRQETKSGKYEQFVREAFLSEDGPSGLRQRMKAMAAGTPLFAEFRRLELKESQGSLLDLTDTQPSAHYTGHQTTINIDIKANNIVIGDQANFSRNVLSAENVNFANTILNEAAQYLDTSHVPADLKREALEAIAGAKSEPTKGRIKHVIDLMVRVKDGAKHITEASDLAIKVHGWIQALGPLVS